VEAVKVAQNRINALAWLNAYPAAVRCLLKHRESLTVHLRFPRKHRNRVRRPNSIVIWSFFEGVFDVRHAAPRSPVLPYGRGYLQSSRRQSLRRDDASCPSHLTGLAA
jgi:putative transposase